MDQILTGAIDDNVKKRIVWHPISVEHLITLTILCCFQIATYIHQEKLKSLVDKSSYSGLTINTKKTKSLCIRSPRPVNFEIKGERVEEVENFTNLGSEIIADGKNRHQSSTSLSTRRLLSAEQYLEIQANIFKDKDAHV